MNSWSAQRDGSIGESVAGAHTSVDKKMGAHF